MSCARPGAHGATGLFCKNRTSNYCQYLQTGASSAGKQLSGFVILKLPYSKVYFRGDRFVVSRNRGIFQPRALAGRSHQVYKVQCTVLCACVYI